MSSTITLTETETFTITHARYLATKVSTDLKRMQRFYEEPSDERIAKYERELIALLKAGYLGKIIYGFRKNGCWVGLRLVYTPRNLNGMLAEDDDPGGIRPEESVAGANFGSYLTYSSAWQRLSDTERDKFERSLPFCRQGALEPADTGDLVEDRTYSSGGRALDRVIKRSKS